MMKKVLLMYPGHLNQSNAELPLSVLYLGSWLEKHNIPYDIIDARFKDYTDIDTDQILCVAISTMTGIMIKKALEIASFFKKKLPDIPIIWGGVHPSMLPEQTLQNPNVDIVCIGEGEETLREVVEAIDAGENIDSIKGIAYEKDGKIFVNPARDFIDMDDLPLTLPYDKINLDDYYLEAFPIHTSRGCPHKCAFCYNKIFNKNSYRRKSPERVLDELEMIIEKFKPEAIFFQEDEFFINLKRVEAIAEGIIDRGIKIKWGSFCRLDSFLKMRDEMLQTIEKSGCVSLSFGGESGNQDVLDIIEKGTKVDYIFNVTERMKNTNIRMIISFMMGIPGETYEQFLDTLDAINRVVEINPDCHPNGIFLYTAYPGTKLMDFVCEKYNYNMPGTLEEWGDYKIYRNTDITWINRKLATKYKYISIMARFPIFRDDYEIPSHFTNSILHKLAYIFYTKTGRFRWKKKFFSFPLELIILEKVLEKQRGFV